MDLLPAIDLLDGKAVRLRQGRYDEVTVYSSEPAELARQWARQTKRVHVVDLDGARDGVPVQIDLIRSISRAAGGRVQVGGGVRSRETLEAYFALGVERVVLGTAAIADEELVRDAAAAHPGQVVIAVDAKAGFVATDGWLEITEQRAVDLAKAFAGAPLAGVLYTDIDRDGTEVGPNVAATEALARGGGVNVIASGGVGSLAHLRALAEAAERTPTIVAAIVGRALHEGRFTVEEAQRAAGDPRAPA